MKKHHFAGHRSLIGLTVMFVAFGLAGCDRSESEEKKATQSAARVNKHEITIHQINRVLQTQRGVSNERLEEASRQVLERLIDQELAVQKAEEQKLDRDAKVVAAIEAAKREIIAKAYFDKIAEGAPKPTEDEIKKYYAENPSLFAERRIYQLQEVAIEAAPAEVVQLRTKLDAAKGPAEFIQALRAANVKFGTSQAVRPAEQVPMSVLPTLARMKNGDSIFTTTPTGAQVVFLLASRTQPVDEARARQAIETFLINERKRKLVADDVKSLRAKAEIKYLGKFAEGAPAAEVIRTAPTPAEVAASASKALDEAAIKSGFGLKDAGAASGARQSAPIAEPVAPSASSIDASTINKGLGIGK